MSCTVAILRYEPLLNDVKSGEVTPTVQIQKLLRYQMVIKSTADVLILQSNRSCYAIWCVLCNTNITLPLRLFLLFYL